jgi:DNA-binding transcriptional regulator GbsR (MarR family)
MPADESRATEDQHPKSTRITHTTTSGETPHAALLTVISVLTEMYEETSLGASRIPVMTPSDTSTGGARAAQPLPPVSQRFVLHWGEMGSRWGVNRTVAQIHALLYLGGRPMDAEEIADTLVIARSNVSNSLRELINLKLVTLVHRMGERREHFETFTDPWILCRTIVRERKLREFDPTLSLLEACIADPQFASEDPARQERIRDTLSLMRQLSGWVDELLRLEPTTLGKLMKLGGKVTKFLGSAKNKGKAA